MARPTRDSSISGISLTGNATSDKTLTQSAGIIGVIHRIALSALSTFTVRFTASAIGYHSTTNTGITIEKETLDTGCAR
jgi:hypothetical protein